MYLKSLEIQGFKSFPDKTVLQFGSDITAIVGPNGSGKSNISDAIRWVMGEQSTKALRGAKMEDVIFGGTQKRPQMGFAEVSLVLDNADHALAVDTPEVMVTRRYYRSGDSEYYINRQSARLRDVNELFMDTGLGKEGYANISQGRIDEILAVKSTDRREIFEEAAGISKYRHRKEETERRLNNTEENLLRIGDKIAELELQVGPLKDQAEKAKKFLAWRDELKGVEVAVWLANLARLEDTAKKAESDYTSAAFILRQEHDALESLYGQAEELAQQLRQSDERIDHIREEIAQKEAQRQQLEGQLDLLSAERKHAQENIARVQEEIAAQDDRNGGIARQIREKQERIAAIDQQTQAQQQKLSCQQQELRRLADSAEGMTKEYLQLRNRHAELQADGAVNQADAAALADAIARAEERKAEVLADGQAAAQRQKETENKLLACQGELKRAREVAEQSKNILTGQSLRHKTRKEKQQQLQNDLNALVVEADTVASRLRMLQEMEREYEGFSKAVRVVMQEARRGRLPNVHGPVSRLIQTDDQYTVAIEIALGGAMQHIVVDHEQDGKAAIGLLKQRDCGRATFLPISAMRGKALQEPGLSGCPGFIGIASGLVRCDPRYLAVIENLLGRTVICDDLDHAIGIARRFNSRFKIVTLDGQVMNAGGSMTGGSVSRSAGVLSRANEIERLSQRQQLLSQRKADTEKALAQAQRQLQQTEFAIADAEDKLRQAEDCVLKREGEEKQYTVLLSAIQQAVDIGQREIASLDQRAEQDKTRRIALEANCELLQKQCQALLQQMEAVSAGQSEAAEKSNQMADAITDLRMEISALLAERSTAAEAMAQLESLSQAMEGDKGQKLALIQAESQRVAELEQTAKRAEGELTASAAALKQTQETLQAALEDRKALDEEKTKAQRDAQQKNKDIIDMERESARLESKKDSAQMEEKQILDRLWDTYELTPNTAKDAAAEITSTQEAGRRMAELRRKISALGTPNLGAIDEYARVSERYAYLTGQRDDVLHAKRELEGVVREITGRMTEIFTEEFAKINRYFGQTFAEMFGGGKGSLELEDPDDPLACGIDIKVQPPGKQLKTITLLSGGEKAFVAIALYFAILKVRPTPFCMLDEIDAALDDRNVERFAGYLRFLSKKVQFLVVTHRRGTMEEADELFGVTMQEQGISKIIHLDLNAMEQQLGITTQ